MATVAGTVGLRPGMALLNDSTPARGGGARGRLPAWPRRQSQYGDRLRGLHRQAAILGTEPTRQAILDGAPKDASSELEQARAHLAELEKAVEAEQDPLAQREAALSVSWTRARVESLPELRVTAPQITFARELVLHGARRRARLVSLGSGSTASDVLLHLPEDGILFTGDLVMHGMHPIPTGVDVPETPRRALPVGLAPIFRAEYRSHK